MKKSYLIPFTILFFILSFMDTNAQVAPEETSAYDLSELTHLGGTRIYDVNSTDVQGTPLLSEEFKNGRFLFRADKQSEIVPINYDLERNLILYKKDDQIMILNNMNVTGFTFEQSGNGHSSESVREEYTFQVNNNEFNFTEPTPIQVLYDENGSVQLYAVHQKKLVRGNRQDPFTGKVTNRYKSNTDYYLKTPDQQVHELRRLRAKDIIKAIGNNSEIDLNEFVDENDLDEKSEKDLVRLLEYYDKEIIAGID